MKRAHHRPAATRAGGAPTLAFVTLGCPKNTVDSESMLGLMVADGFRTVGDPREADIAVVNTCAFLSSAVRESRDTIARVAELKHTGRLRGLIIAGCLAQRAGETLLSDFPEVDAVLGTGQWREVVPAARHVLAGGARRAQTDYPGGALDALIPRALSTPRHLAYLKLSEGCDPRCTFCIIPRLRGDQRSRPVEDLVAEAERLARAGVRELNLIGQDTTGYGSDLPGRPTLADLLAALADKIAATDPFDLAETEKSLRGVAAEKGVKAGLLINATRVALTGQAVAPGLFDVMVTLGRQRVVARLRRGAASLGTRSRGA